MKKKQQLIPLLDFLDITSGIWTNFQLGYLQAVDLAEVTGGAVFVQENGWQW